MVRAYKELRKPDATPRVTKFFCANCDEWDEDHNWTRHIAYRNYGRYVFHDTDEDGDVYIFGSESEKITVYEHNGCGEWFVDPEKDASGDKDIYVCGACSKRTYDQNAARRCCS